jgi:hypothetical protein
MPVIAPILIGSLFAIVQGTATAGPMPSFSPVPKPTLRVMLTRQNCQMVQQYVQECSRSCQQRRVFRGGVYIWVTECQPQPCYRWQRVCN